MINQRKFYPNVTDLKSYLMMDRYLTVTLQYTFWMLSPTVVSVCNVHVGVIIAIQHMIVSICISSLAWASERKDSHGQSSGEGSQENSGSTGESCDEG